MQNTKVKFGIWFLVIGICLVIGYWSLVILVSSCGKLAPFAGQATTNLKSSTLYGLSTLGINPQSTTTIESGTLYLTPNKITGKIASIVLAISNREDEGVVIFGDGRPDIKKANTALYDFDMTKINTFSGVISKPPWYTGGTVEVIPMLYGYFDVTFEQGGQTREVRMVYGDTDPYVRGDQLLKKDEKWQWYDTITGTFTSETRPSSPAVNSNVANFTDPVRPQMHYYYLAARVNQPVSLPASLIDNNNLTFTIDYRLINSVAFTGITSESQFNSLSEADLVQKFDMKQNVSDWWISPGITCDLTVEATPR